MVRKLTLLTISFVLLLILVTSYCQTTSNLTFQTKSIILDEFMAKNDFKQLFKVWHFLMNKDYDYNSIEGISKFKNFRNKVKQIQEHNSQNLSYKKGLNHLSDMTFEEIEKFYNLKRITIPELKKNIRASFNLDDYNEDDDDVSINIDAYAPRTPVEWRKSMRPVRNQGECGSCWAFSTMAVVEGAYNIKNPKSLLKDWLSTQQLVDCDSSNNGCNGGWFDGALDYLKQNTANYENDYPYTGILDTCKAINSSSIKVKSYTSTSNAPNLYALLKSGPVSVAVDANEDFANYSSGVFDTSCKEEPNHAVVLVGYATDKKGGYWIIRNSWSEDWGLKGHIYVREDATNENSCNIGKFGYKPTLA
jgi:C1A family cysteine protease